MGEERSRKGKHFLFRIACCVSVFLGFCGCVQSLKQWQGEQDLREAKHLMSTGNYPACEKKTLSVLETSPQTLGDEALFQMGLLYALPKNANASYEKSKTYFEKLVTQYPESDRKEEAAAWLLALTRVIRNEKETLELQEKLTILEQASEAKGRKLKQMQEDLEAREKEINELKQMRKDLEARKKEIDEHRDAVSQLQSRVKELESQLAKFKNIDLTIEQKKRATVP
jgi:chromosome segregation ATPase